MVRPLTDHRYWCAHEPAQEDAARLANLVLDYVAAWNNLEVPGDDADEMLVNLNRIARDVAGKPNEARP